MSRVMKSLGPVTGSKRPIRHSEKRSLNKLLEKLKISNISTFWELFTMKYVRVSSLWVKKS